jgi:predicted HicB family RNase H-like nuclease
MTQKQDTSSMYARYTAKRPVLTLRLRNYTERQACERAAALEGVSLATWAARVIREALKKGK